MGMDPNADLVFGIEMSDDNRVGCIMDYQKRKGVKADLVIVYSGHEGMGAQILGLKSTHIDTGVFYARPIKNLGTYMAATPVSELKKQLQAEIDKIKTHADWESEWINGSKYSWYLCASYG